MAGLPHLVLGGFMGAGKSTIGRVVAARAGVPFVDLDDAILEDARAAGQPFPSTAALFTTLGQPAFRRYESGALARLLAAEPPSVIATGGGALVDPASRALALARGRVVTLTAPPEVLLARISLPGQPRRALIEDAPDRGEAVHAILAARAAAYAEAHATIATDVASPDELAEAVLRAWRCPAVVVRLGERSYSVRFTGAGEAVGGAGATAAAGGSAAVGGAAAGAPVPAGGGGGAAGATAAAGVSAAVDGGDGAGAVVADVLAVLRPTRWLLVTDATVDSLWGAAFSEAVVSSRSAPVAPPAAVVRLVPGERHKTLAAVEHILHSALAAGLDRSSVIVAHGGGVTSDVAGFAAAVYLRGVRWVSVPTTLLSMADAAIGGKTGVDVGSAKNAAGAFHQPSAVVVDVRRVVTETDRAFTSGLAEIVKSGAVADASLVALLERETAAVRARSLPVLEEALAASAAVKAAIVAADERETSPVGSLAPAPGTLSRAFLNFGHTLGHALEAAGGFDRWTHGEAVSLGMVGALRAGVALGLTPPPVADRLVSLLAALGLPVRLALSDVESALPYLGLDKKRSAGSIRAVFLAHIAHPILRPIPLADLASLYRAAATSPAR